LVSLQASSRYRFEFRGESRKCGEQICSNVFCPHNWNYGSGMEDGRARSGIDLDAHFGGIFQKALSIIKGFLEIARDPGLILCFVNRGVSRHLLFLFWTTPGSDFPAVSAAENQMAWLRQVLGEGHLYCSFHIRNDN
jgi:hypothetical protein